MPIANGARFTSGFGKRNISYGPNDHWGLDFGGRWAGKSEYVMAAADGVVAWIKTIKFRSGPVIGIRHPDGSLTAYVHTRNHKVKPGQSVRRGEIIAESWHTGIRIEAGIHLHFEWWADAEDHTSVFDPRERLAQYGWVLQYDAAVKKYRMHDEWEGRPTKTPPKTESTTQTGSATPVQIIPHTTPSKESELSMSDVKTILDELAKINARVDSMDRRMTSGIPVDNRQTVAFKVDGENGQVSLSKTRFDQELRVVADTTLDLLMQVAASVGMNGEQIAEFREYARRKLEVLVPEDPMPEEPTNA